LPVVTTLAGSAGSPGSADGTGSAARFNYPVWVAVDASGVVYVSDQGNNAIRKVMPNGVVTTVVGAPGAYGNVPGPLPASLYYPKGIAVIPATGGVYIAVADAIFLATNQ
jgi:DNA-binding beta-propeller fold protein YncE